MTSILMLFADDYGSFTDSTIFMAFMVLCLVFYFSKKYAIKNDDTIAGISVFLYMVFMFSYLFTVSPTHIPQYGTQTQKEMLTFCIQEKTENGLTAEDREDIAGTIKYIMKACKKNYDKLEAKHKRELEHKKFLLKNKEILDSLDKVLIEQGVK